MAIMNVYRYVFVFLKPVFEPQAVLVFKLGDGVS